MDLVGRGDLAGQITRGVGDYGNGHESHTIGIPGTENP